MRRALATATRLSLAIILLTSSGIAHCEEDAFSKWAAAHALPIATVEPGDDFSDLLPLKSVVGTAHVVALGEPVHGAHEPVAFRNRLFRFLVEQMGFTAIALESGFTESISARSFIESGEGDAETATRTGLTGESGRSIENRELIQWMRDYNATAAASGHHKIRLYGFAVAAGARLSGPWRTIDYALTFLSRADPTTAQKIRDTSTDSLPKDDGPAYSALPPAAQAQFETSIQAIAKAMQKSRKRLMALSSDEEYRWALHNLDVARQLAKLMPMTPPKSASMSSWVATMAQNDLLMAENVQWAVKNEGRQGRLFVFAHNSHVMNEKEDGRRWASARGRPPMMGLHLHHAYGKNLYIIAMSCANGTQVIPTARPIEADSIESTLIRVGLPLWFLDLRVARQNQDAFEWLTVRRSFNANLQTQALITPSTAVDAFFFVNTLTPAILGSD